MLLKAGTVVAQYAIRNVRKPCQTVLRNTQKAASIRNWSIRCALTVVRMALLTSLVRKPKRACERERVVTSVRTGTRERVELVAVGLTCLVSPP